MRWGDHNDCASGREARILGCSPQIYLCNKSSWGCERSVCSLGDRQLGLYFYFQQTHRWPCPTQKGGYKSSTRRRIHFLSKERESPQYWTEIFVHTQEQIQGWGEWVRVAKGTLDRESVTDSTHTYTYTRAYTQKHKGTFINCDKKQKADQWLPEAGERGWEAGAECQ